MSNEQFLRDYRMPDYDLTVFTQHICDCMTRDIVQFTKYGVTADNVTNLQTMCDAFELFSTDEYVNQEYLSVVLLRNNIYDALHVVVRSMALRVELKWGKNSPKYKSLGIADMSKQPVNSYLTESRMIHSFMTEHLIELSAEGLTQAMLDDMETLINQLDDAIRETIEKSSYRMEMTTLRITNGNKLYDLVSKYCEIGKRIWDKVNPAFYNDYVIYDKASPGVPGKPDSIWFFQPNLTLWWNVVENATSYQLEKLEGSEYIEIYAGPNDNYPFVPPDGLSKYRVRARNDNGYGPFSDVLDLWYFAVLPKPSNIQINQSEVVPTECTVTCDVIPTVSDYRYYQSVDDIGQAPAHWLYRGAVSEPQKVCTLTLGKRNFFKIECSNGLQTSISDPVYIDV